MSAEQMYRGSGRGREKLESAKEYMETKGFSVDVEQIEAAVRLSGLTKQDYITRRLLCRDVVVQGNPKVYKALRDQLAAVLDELRRAEDGAGVDDELLDTIQMIAAIMGGMKED